MPLIAHSIRLEPLAALWHNGAVMFIHPMSADEAHPQRRSAARIATVVFAYTVLGLALTWPLAARFLTHVPGDGIDDPSLAWNLWWVKHALVDVPQNPFDCSWQFWPIGINLAFYTLTVLNGMLGIPLQAVFGLIPTYNLLLLSSFVLSGLGGYLLAREFLGGTGRNRLCEHEGRGTGAGTSALADVATFVGGALYAFASAKLFYAGLGQGNIASSQWASFAALYIWRAARPRGTARDATLAALFLILQAYAELTYASFLLIFAALAFLWGLRGRLWPLLGRFAVMAALFSVGIAPVLAAMLPDLAAEGDFFTSGGGFADIFSADLAGYAVPTQLHPVLGDLARNWSEQVSQGGAGRQGGAVRQFAIDKGQHIYVGYVALVLAMAGAWKGRRSRATWLWVGAAGLFFLLTLGPSLRVAGYDTGIPLPFRIIEQLPFFKGNRYPSRYAVMLLLSLAPLVAGGALAVLRAGLAAGGRHWAANRQDTPRLPAHLPLLAAAMLGLMLFEHLSAPLPVSDLRVPALYEQVAREEGDFALLELPLGWRNGARVAGKQDVLIMQQLWYQTTHGKRVLGGNTSRNPEYKFQYFSEQPVLARLIAMTNAADLPQHDALRAVLDAQPVTAAGREQAAAWAAFTNIRYVMVHRDKLTAETEAVAKDLLSLSLLAEEGDLALYRVAQQPAPAIYRLDTDEGRLALGEGWSPVGTGEGRSVDAEEAGGGVIAQRREVRLLLPLGAGAAELRLRAAALAPEQRLSVVVDGESLGEQPLSMADGWVSFDVPADVRRSPQRGALSDVRLRFSRVVGADTLAMQLGSGGPVGLLVRSAGQEAGDFGHIYLNGCEVSPNGRGYNLVSLDPRGNLLAAASFDTHADPVASAHLAKWLAAQPPGTLVAGAVRDEASMNLEAPALDALRLLSVTTDLRGHFRWGHAFIAVASLPGEAASVSWSTPQEGADAVRPVQASLGLPLSEPQVAAQFYEVQITYK